MKVRLGTSFVTHSSMNKEIQRQLAMRGAQGRRMLQRKCFVAKKELIEKGVTLLTLMIVEGYLVERRQLVALWKAMEDNDGENKRVEEFLKKNKGKVLKALEEEVSIFSVEEVISQTRLTAREESLYRENKRKEVDVGDGREEGKENGGEWKGDGWKDDTKPLSVVVEYDDELWAPYSTLTIEISSPLLCPSGNLTLTLKERTEVIYPCIFDFQTATPRTSALYTCETRLFDPLSVCSFLSLIEENNTLPAALYVLSPNQPPGVLFYTSEYLNVRRGGFEMTSLDYFRLYSRLCPTQHDDEPGDGARLVQVPGTFHLANAAIPLAPEPFTAAVMDGLMGGLVCEFVTGTPMLPLGDFGCLYVGYLFMHMRRGKEVTGLDIERMGDLMATLRCWLQRGVKRVEKWKGVVESLVKNKGVTTQVFFFFQLIFFFALQCLFSLFFFFLLHHLFLLYLFFIFFRKVLAANSLFVRLLMLFWTTNLT